MKTEAKINSDILKDRESLSTAIAVVPLFGVVFKNILFCSFVYGPNYYETNFVAGLQSFSSHLYISLAIAVLFASVALLMKKKQSRFIYWLALDIIATVLNLGYLCYIRAYNDVPSIAVLGYMLVGSNEDIPGDIADLIVPFAFADVLFVLDFIIIFALSFWKSRLGNFSFGERSFVKNPIEKANFVGKSKRRAEGARKCAFIAVTAVTAICLLVAPLDYEVKGAASAAYSTSYGTSISRDKASALSIAGYLADDLSKLMFAPKTATEEEIRLVESYFEWNKGNYAPSQYTGRFVGKNVIFVQVESLEDFVIGNFIDGQEITPNINKLLKKSYYFPNIKDRVASGNSSDCDTMVMLSMAPSTGVGTFNSFSHNAYNSLPMVLNRNGYDTAYYNGAGGSIWNYPDMMENGIKFDGADFDFDKKHKIQTYISDESLFNQALDKMERRGFLNSNNPFYAHITLCNSHAPFRMPKELQKLKLSKGLKKNVMGDYLQSIHYFDEVFGRFIENAESRGFLDDTIILLTGDHRGVHKYYPHEINKLSDADYKEWMEKNNESALSYIIYDPTMPDGEARTFEAFGTHMDAMPTLVDLLGLPYEEIADTAMGRSLFSPAFNATIDGSGVLYGTYTEEDRAFMLSSFKAANTIFKYDMFKNQRD